MSDNKNQTATAVTANPWERLRTFTDARIGLGRAGISVPTKHLLEFQLAHARAQDAVHSPLDIDGLIANLQKHDWAADLPTLALQSRAEDRAQYLQRPDLGRELSDVSTETLREQQTQMTADYDLAIAVVDGLSAFAIEENLIPFLQHLLPSLRGGQNPWRLAPISFVAQGRVAIGDPIGEGLNASCVLVLIGERPGLSSPDSLGVYLTWNPRKGCHDAQRNCISNVRAAGLDYREASRRTCYLLNEARQRRLSGVNLKDRSSDEQLDGDNINRNFLVSGS